MVDREANLSLNAVFGALADPTRRAMLEQLARGPRTIRDLSEPFDISAPGISKHLRVLEESGLIRRTRVGRITYCQLTRKPFADAGRWLAEHEAFWEQQFTALDAFLKEDAWLPPPAPGASRSGSPAVSQRRRNASSTPGRRRKR